METYQNILVVIDPESDDQIALERAIQLAQCTKATITAFLSIFDFSYEMTTMLSSDERESMRQTVIDDRTQWIQERINQIDCQSIVVTPQVLWHSRPFEAIIEQVINHHYDIVLKGTRQHDKLKSVIFTPTDWHLLRKCPCPVLLVKEHSWPENGNIIAAVNVGSDETEHQSLNERVTQQAQFMACLLQANVHLVNSYPGTPVNIAIEIPEFDASQYNHTMQKHHQESMTTHANQFSIPQEQTHVHEGLPEDVIEQLSSTLDAELVVLGTIGRTGLSAALIGNTAEHVIDRLNCDVLAIKPEGYKSPLQ